MRSDPTAFEAKEVIAGFIPAIQNHKRQNLWSRRWLVQTIRLTRLRTSVRGRSAVTPFLTVKAAHDFNGLN